MHQLFIEMALALSKISQNTSHTQISSMITQATLYEVFLATGVPTAPKGLNIDMGGKALSKVPYPAVSTDAPSITMQLGWIVHALSLLLGKSLT